MRKVRWIALVLAILCLFSACGNALNFETAQDTNEKRNILIIGNSHSIDAYWLLYDAYLDQYPDADLCLGILHYGGGSIDGKKSYIMLAEQGQYTVADYHTRTTTEGISYRIRGNDGQPFTFEKLYKKGFIVHTFKEFLGTDPIEPGEVTVPMETDTVAVDALESGELTANYPISDVFTTVRDENGEIVYEYVKRTTDHFTRSLHMEECVPSRKLRKYRKGGYTIEMTVQLSSGELVNAYKGTLTK